MPVVRESRVLRDGRSLSLLVRRATRPSAAGGRDSLLVPNAPSASLAGRNCLVVAGSSLAASRSRAVPERRPRGRAGLLPGGRIPGVYRVVSPSSRILLRQRLPSLPLALPRLRCPGSPEAPISGRSYGHRIWPCKAHCRRIGADWSVRRDLSETDWRRRSLR